MTDLLALTASLVDIPSVSHDEEAITDWLHGMLDGATGLSLRRIGNNLVARTDLGRQHRLLLAGHTDTVPPAAGNERAVVSGEVLSGLGSSDMKSGVAVLAELARSSSGWLADASVDVTFVFYACEEVERKFSGLYEIEASDPALLAADAAVLLEPTDALVEAGCQGVLKIVASVRGARAHTARPWMGVNAVHRLAGLLALAQQYEGRRPVLDGCEYREAVQAVSVEGGVAGNVVPDLAQVVFNHRFAPDLDVEAAFAVVRDYLAPAIDSSLGDSIELAGSSPPAPPGLGHPLLAALVSATGAAPRAKLGWTDVAFFAERGVPAANFGPGDPNLAHTPGEKVERAPIEKVHDVLRSLISTGAA